MSKQLRFVDRISKALNDNKISDEEFPKIISEVDKYNEMKRDIRNSLIEKNIPNEVELKKEVSSRDDEKITSGFNKSFRIKIEVNCARYKLPSAPPLYEL